MPKFVIERELPGAGRLSRDELRVLLGALNTGARVIVTAADPAAARQQVEETIECLLKGLSVPGVAA